MATTFEYTNQARTYDSTRAASPSVVEPLAAMLGTPTGRARLADIGGGTGNYSVALRVLGWHPIVIDRNRGMLERAAHKELTVVRADAAAVPFPDHTVDAAILVSMLHHVPDWRVALAEARWVVRPGGVVAVMAYAREHLFAHGIEDYFPTTQAHFAAGHQTRDELLDALPGATVSLVIYRDSVDGSLAALARTPERVLDPDLRRQTGFFEWAVREQPAETADGLRRLADDLGAGRRPEDHHAALRVEIGDAFVLAWTAPEAERPVPGSA